jgi:N6-adenosine-specific RNA methylase IME4
MNLPKLKINLAFKALLPPLSVEELAALEAELIKDGCRDALVTWNGTLLDGHNRYALCQKHRIQFQTVEKTFASDEEAMDWIDANQIARRNLTPDAFKLALGRRYNRTKKPPHGRAGRDFSGAQSATRQRTDEKLAKEHGVSKDTVQRAGKFAEEVAKTPALQKAIADRQPVIQVKRAIKEAVRETRRVENRAKAAAVKSPTESGAKYSTIVIDPPWDSGDEGDVNQMGRANPDYGTMTLDQLLALPVAKLADVDCHLYCWVTNRSLPKVFRLIERWGFRFITCLTWPKPTFGTGNYFRGQTEHVVFAIKGSQPLKRKNASTLLPQWKRGRGHSAKPSEWLEFVESCSPGPYLEMFSRNKRKGWSAWGADA